MENRDYLELTFRSINVFADDGKLDGAELKSLVAIAQRDGVIDANERRVLTAIVAKLRPEELTGELAAEVEQLNQLLAVAR